jgi:nitroimidazol reductase NimA-like FMN-containing flavoprotein (pyridoxamine 5'-phosphate oxidase superfamily)
MKRMPPKVRAFVRDAGVCRVASVQANGMPHAAPVCHVLDGDTVYIDVSPGGATAAGLRKNRRVALLVDEYNDEWKDLCGVVLYTRAAQARGEARKKAWRLIRKKYPQSVDIQWNPRLTLAMRITDWKQWGVT